jgi:hypothetical protein
MSVSRGDLWTAIHRERDRLAEDLAALDRDHWHHPALCGAWTVRASSLT